MLTSWPKEGVRFVEQQLILTRQDLESLTGFKQPKRMCEWLEARGWVFEPHSRPGDFPKVDRAYYTQRMTGQHPTRRTNGPRLDFMQQR